MSSKPYFKQGQLIKPGEDQFKFICYYCHNLKSPTVYDSPVQLINSNGNVIGENISNQTTNYFLGDKECELRSKTIGLCKFNKCSGKSLECYVHRACLEAVQKQCEEYMLNQEFQKTGCCGQELANNSDIKIVEFSYYQIDPILKLDMQCLKNMSFYHQTGETLCKDHKEVLDLVYVEQEKVTPICKKCFDGIDIYQKQYVHSLEGYVTNIYENILQHYNEIEKDIKITQNNIDQLDNVIKKIEDDNSKKQAELKQNHQLFISKVNQIQKDQNTKNSKNINDMRTKISYQIQQYKKMQDDLTVVEQTFCSYLDTIQQQEDLAYHVFTDEQKEKELLDLLENLETKLKSDIKDQQEKVIVEQLKTEDLKNAYEQSIRIN